MPPAVDLHARLGAFAETISKGPLGLARYRRDETARPTQCFANVLMKVKRCGGRERFGWMFHYRVVPEIDGLGYLIAVHHAVWHAPDGCLIDVTPFHADEKHHPITAAGDVLFLVDDQAEPLFIHNQLAPLPSKFHALCADARLIAHVEKLRIDEQSACQRIYSSAL